MEKYKFLEHTADAKFQAFGNNLGEAFGNAALAMFSIFSDPDKVKNEHEKGIEAKGKDLKALLYNFLEELLFLFETEGFLLNKIKYIEIKDNMLTAIVFGDYLKEGYEVHGEVKAVTYNEMEIDEKKNMVQVVVDL